MIDINLIRSNPDAVKASLKRKNATSTFRNFSRGTPKDARLFPTSKV